MINTLMDFVKRSNNNEKNDNRKGTRTNFSRNKFFVFVLS